MDQSVKVGYPQKNMEVLSDLPPADANHLWRTVKQVNENPDDYPAEAQAFARLIADPKLAQLKRMGGDDANAKVMVSRPTYQRFLELTKSSEY